MRATIERRYKGKGKEFDENLGADTQIRSENFGARLWRAGMLRS